LDDVHRTIDAVPHCGIGHGLLRYFYAPTARQLGAVPHADVFFSYLGTIPDLPIAEGPVQLDMDAAMPAREMLPGLGHALELRVYRTAGLLHLDWWFDTRRLQRSEVETLADRFPVALTELTQEVIASAGQDGETTAEYQEMALVDLSALDS
jgi:phthiocerol/phenolphthiocerol synthesis type-I polyketide synthase E